MVEMGFDGVDLGGVSRNDWCDCGRPYHEHDKERVYPDDGPPGSWHYTYTCP